MNFYLNCLNLKVKNSLFNQANVSMGTAGVAGGEQKSFSSKTKKVSQHYVGNMNNKMEGKHRKVKDML